MKLRNYLFIAFTFLSLISCNNEVILTPLSDVPADDSGSIVNPTPDFNFVSTPAFRTTFKDQNFRYSMPVQLYVRPFINVTDTTQFTLLYNTNKFAQLIVLGDTLLPGDKKRLTYGQFSNYRIVSTYTSLNEGPHDVKLSMTANRVTKQSDFQLLTN
jgi:hypothetical protein